MSGRKDFFYRQLVDEATLDDAFTGLEDADRAVVQDSGLGAESLSAAKGGIHQGLTVSNPAGLDVQVLAGVGYDDQGRRVATDATYTIDISQTGTTAVGAGGTPTGGVLTFPGIGLYRWVSVFLVFDRDLQTPRVDGMGATVYLDRLESFRFTVSHGTPGPAPTPPPLEASKLLLGDFRVTDAGVIDQISLDRRQSWIRAYDSGAVPITRVGTGYAIRGLVAEAGVREAIRQLLGYYNDHVNPAVGADAHTGATVTYAGSFPPHTWADGTVLAAGTVEAAIDGILVALGGFTGGTQKISGEATTTGGVDDLVQAKLADQLTELVQFINDRLELSASAGLQTVQDGIIVTASTANARAVEATGDGTGEAGYFEGGALAPFALEVLGGGANGGGIELTAQGSGIGISLTGAAGSGIEVQTTTGRGVYIETTSAAADPALWIDTSGGRGAEIFVHGTGNDSALRASTSATGTGDAIQASAFGGATGAAIRADAQTTAPNDATIVATTFTTNPAIRGETGLAGYGIFGIATAAGGIAIGADATGAANYAIYAVGGAASVAAVHGQNTVAAGVGLQGNASAASGVGVRGSAAGAGGTGVLGTGGTVGPGVWGVGGATGPGVYGQGGASGARGGYFLGVLTGEGLKGEGGATNGVGVLGQGTGTGVGGSFAGGAGGGGGVAGFGIGAAPGGAFAGDLVGPGSGDGAWFFGGLPDGNGLDAVGAGTGTGVIGEGGPTDGTGGSFTGGGTNGDGVHAFSGGAGDGIVVTSSGSGHGINLNKTGSGSGVDINVAGGTGFAIDLFPNTTRAPIRFGDSGATPSSLSVTGGELWRDGGVLKFYDGVTVYTIDMTP